MIDRDAKAAYIGESTNNRDTYQFDWDTAKKLPFYGNEDLTHYRIKFPQQNSGGRNSNYRGHSGCGLYAVESMVQLILYGPKGFELTAIPSEYDVFRRFRLFMQMLFGNTTDDGIKDLFTYPLDYTRLDPNIFTIQADEFNFDDIIDVIASNDIPAVDPAHQMDMPSYGIPTIQRATKPKADDIVRDLQDTLARYPVQQELTAHLRGIVGVKTSYTPIEYTTVPSGSVALLFNDENMYAPLMRYKEVYYYATHFRGLNNKVIRPLSIVQAPVQMLENIADTQIGPQSLLAYEQFMKDHLVSPTDKFMMTQLGELLKQDLLTAEWICAELFWELVENRNDLLNKKKTTYSQRQRSVFTQFISSNPINIKKGLYIEIDGTLLHFNAVPQWTGRMLDPVAPIMNLLIQLSASAHFLLYNHHFYSSDQEVSILRSALHICVRLKKTLRAISFQLDQIARSRTVYMLDGVLCECVSGLSMDQISQMHGNSARSEMHTQRLLSLPDFSGLYLWSV